MKLDVAIIGCGDMGHQHLAGWQACEDAQVVAVCDPIQERREKFASESGATPYETHQDATKHEGVNVVSVCTPVCFHSEIACFAANSGKHVLSEKPLALTLEQADAMIDAAKANGVLLSTSFQYRGVAKNARLKKLFEEGAFGGPVFARYIDIRPVRPKIAMHRRSMNGGPVIDMASHYFDLMRMFTGKEAISVSARGHVFGQGKNHLAGIGDLAIDAADIQVTMEGGHVLNVYVNWGMPEGYPGYGTELFVGPSLSVRPEGGKLLVQGVGINDTWDPGVGNPPGSTVRINDLAAAIRENRQPEVTGENGRQALKLSLAALESIRTGEIIRF